MEDVVRPPSCDEQHLALGTPLDAPPEAKGAADLAGENVRRGRPAHWEVARQRLELADRTRGVRGVDALLELRGREAAFRAVLAE